MVFANLSRIDRMILVGTLAMIVIAIMFPVKETVFWNGTRWERWAHEMVHVQLPADRPNTILKAPLPPVGSEGRGIHL